MIWLALAAVLAVGYALGRARFATRLLDWAEDATGPGWRTWKFWLAVPILLVALAWIWTVHPRRSLANARSWRQETARQAAPLTRCPGCWRAGSRGLSGPLTARETRQAARAHRAAYGPSDGLL